MARNPTERVLAIGVFDDLHAQEKLIVFVQPDPDQLGGLPVPTFEGPLPTPPPDNPREVEVNIEKRNFRPTAARAKAGSTLSICNLETARWKPFSFSVHNAFQLAGTLAPGKCLRRTLRNPTEAPISMKVFDEIHARARLEVTVLPR